MSRDVPGCLVLLVLLGVALGLALLAVLVEAARGLGSPA